MKWDRSPFSPDIRTFWYIVSKNSNRFYIIFTDLCVGGLVFWIFVKIHWILRIKQTSVLFCKYLHNKSSDLHEIFVVVIYYHVTFSFEFHEDPSINASIRVVNMRAHVLSRVRTFTTRARARLRLMDAHLCRDLHEIWDLGSKVSNWLPHKISWRSELSLWR